MSGDTGGNEGSVALGGGESRTECALLGGRLALLNRQHQGAKKIVSAVKASGSGK